MGGEIFKIATNKKARGFRFEQIAKAKWWRKSSLLVRKILINRFVFEYFRLHYSCLALIFFNYYYYYIWPDLNIRTELISVLPSTSPVWLIFQAFLLHQITSNTRINKLYHSLLDFFISINVQRANMHSGRSKLPTSSGLRATSEKRILSSVPRLAAPNDDTAAFGMSAQNMRNRQSMLGTNRLSNSAFKPPASGIKSALKQTLYTPQAQR